MTTIITNNNGISFELNTEISKAEMFKTAQEFGFTGGKTSFNNLVTGKVTAACGFVLQELVEAPVLTAAPADSSKVSVLENLKAIKEFASMIIKAANTETYATFQVGMGRVQISPVKNNQFSVMVFPRKGYVSEEVVEAAGFGEVKSQYAKLPTMDVNGLRNLFVALK